MDILASSCKQRRNACFETIMNSYWKPGKGLDLALKTPNPIKRCYWVTSYLKHVGRKRFVVKQETKITISYVCPWKSNLDQISFPETLWGKKKIYLDIFSSATMLMLIETSNCGSAQFGKKLKICWISCYLFPSRYLFQDREKKQPNKQTKTQRFTWAPKLKWSSWFCWKHTTWLWISSREGFGALMFLHVLRKFSYSCECIYSICKLQNLSYAFTDPTMTGACWLFNFSPD